MPLQATPYTLPLLAVGLGYAAFATYLLRQRERRRVQTTRLAAGLFLGMAAWLLAYAGTLSVTTLSGKLVFARLQYLGPATVPPLWFAYVLTFTGYGDWLDRRRWAALAAPPVGVLAMVAAYPASELVWRSADLVDAGSWTAMVVDHGVGFYAYQVYVYALFALSVLLLVRHYRDAGGVYRRQTGALLAGAAVPAVAGLVYVLELSPFPELDLPAVSLVFTAGAVAYSVLEDDLFTLAPVAWETAIADLEDPVFVVNTGDLVVAANDAAREFADTTVGAPASETLGDVFDEPYWQRPGDHVFDTFRDGTPCVYEVSVTPVERAGSQVGNVVVVRDVTERHNREQRLEEFASVVSHDLRNPLNVARGHLELGRETGDDHHFAAAEDAMDRMERIIDDLLTLAREGESEFDAEPVSLGETAHTAWAAVDSMDADATLDVDSDRELVADETGLLRLFENLFRNAVEHAATGPDSQAEHGSEGVTVSVGALGEAGDSRGFYVADDGPGIPEDEREQVFESGYTTSDEGTGFGLAIVQEVADAHGWRVEVCESESGGARFEFAT
jgi:signal transduction histidine kinase